MNKKAAFNILRVVISVGLILLLVWLMRNSFGEVVLAIKKINKLIFFLGFLCFVLGAFLLSVRLRLIMKAQHLLITQKEAFSLVLVGYFFNNFLPTAIGGDVVKIYYTSKKTGKNLLSIACIVFDRLLGTFTLILMALVTFLFVREEAHNKSVITFLVIALGVSVMASFVLFSRRIAKKIPLLSALFRKFNLEEKMKGLYEVIYNYKKHPRLIINAVCISFGLQIIMFYSIYLIIRGLTTTVGLKTVFLFMPIISTVSMAPSINGLGVRESSFVLLYGPLMGKEAAFAVSILWLGLNFFVSLSGGVLYLFSKQYRLKGGAVLK